MRDDRRIRAVISRIVPPAATDHVSFCRLEGRRLRVTLDGAAWIPKLRFCERTLLAALIREGFDVRTVSWHVTPARAPAARRTAARPGPAPSERAARAVRGAIDAGAGEDDALARQMRRMARHLAGDAAPGEPGRGEGPAPDGATPDG